MAFFFKGWSIGNGNLSAGVFMDFDTRKYVILQPKKLPV